MMSLGHEDFTKIMTGPSQEDSSMTNINLVQIQIHIQYSLHMIHIKPVMQWMGYPFPVK